MVGCRSKPHEAKSDRRGITDDVQAWKKNRAAADGETETEEFDRIGDVRGGVTHGGELT